MHPSGFRFDEEKKMDPRDELPISPGAKSSDSYRSTRSSRSSVLERAREYNRRVGTHKLDHGDRRAKSLERDGSDAGASGFGGSSYGASPRSKSAGPRSTARGNHGHSANRTSTHERAMASVRKDSARMDAPKQRSQQQIQNSYTEQTQPLTPVSNCTTSSSSQPSPSRQMHSSRQQNMPNAPATPAERTDNSVRTQDTNSPTTTTTSAQQRTNSNYYEQQRAAHHGHNHQRTGEASMDMTPNHQQQRGSHQQSRSHGNNNRQTSPRGDSQSPQSKSSKSKKSQDNGNENAIVSPELLVDALSGHEDGLLAIAERLMEHYDAGYDVMGEAIIDAFADVQKLFQHVVEAAHMEGAAFEANRREEEKADSRRRGDGSLEIPDIDGDGIGDENGLGLGSPQNTGGPNRHDEFIDHDIKEVLTEAIRKGSHLRESNKHQECYTLLQTACQQASEQLPVDSDHRGRLQLSIARAESMSPDRACAILRYAIDDVLRSGQRAGKTPLPDVSQRADVVLSRPARHPSMSGRTGHANHVHSGVVQSADEALASIIEEMKEILSAPVYNDTPLQDVAKRFWAALNESQKKQKKNEDQLEQNLAKLKGDYLLARAEWEEKLTQSNKKVENYKNKYDHLKKETRGGELGGYLDSARSFTSRMTENRCDETVESNDYSTPTHGGISVSSSIRSIPKVKSTAKSVASLGSDLASHAKSLVNSMGQFHCNNDNSGNVVASETHERGRSRYGSRRELSGSKSRYAQQSNRVNNVKTSAKSPKYADSPSRSSSSHRSRQTRPMSSRSFKDYSQSPESLEV